MTGMSSILIIAHRDLLKLLRDPLRILATFVSPFLIIGVFGEILQVNLGSAAGFNFIAFMLTGVFAQTLFMSSAQGIISLIDDRENDFSQTIFVSPVSRYVIILGKLVGETMVALPQGIGIVIFGLIIGIAFTWQQVLGLFVVAVVVCLFGGAFGLLLLSNINSRRAASEIFTYIIMPQYFLSGALTPIKVLPPYLDVLSRITPLRYAVDLVRGIFYSDHPDFQLVVLQSLTSNLFAVALLFVIFLILGTFLFVRKERNR